VPEPDVVVVGGRVAGASTALLLARSGLRVALLDRGRYGSDALSTHGLMRGGVLQLGRWGLLGRLVGAGTPAIRRTRFHYGDGETVEVSLRPSPGVDALYAPRRLLLDRILVDAAADAGVEVRHGTAVTSLLWKDGRVVGVRARDGAGRERVVRAAVTVGADGVRSTVADQTGAPVVRRARCGGAVLYRYYADLPTVGYEWAYGEHVAAGLIPTNDELTCVFVGTSPQRMRELRRGGASAAFSALLAGAFPGLPARVAAAAPAGRHHGWAPLPGYVRRGWGPGWALVGDAGYYKDPITTHGITDGLRDAELLADAIVDTLGGAVPEEVALARYQESRDLLSAPLFSVTDAVAAYDWGTCEVRGLLRQVSAAMAHELRLLPSLVRRPPSGQALQGERAGLRHQPQVPEPPLNGPTTRSVIHPP
jgi:2-polyprenyl-6-methoxyphenol hydroxylase-like FAD-dependent oxidoreductase